MKVTARRIGTCVLLLLGLTLAPPLSAQSAGPSLKQQLLGHWQLVSVAVGERTPMAPRRKARCFSTPTGIYPSS